MSSSFSIAQAVRKACREIAEQERDDWVDHLETEGLSTGSRIEAESAYNQADMIARRISGLDLEKVLEGVEDARQG